MQQSGRNAAIEMLTTLTYPSACLSGWLDRIDPNIPESDIEAEFRKMDEEDEEQGVVAFDDFCTWMAERVVGLPSRPNSAASAR